MQLFSSTPHPVSLHHSVKLANILESYIKFLFDRYGIENTAFDLLIENIKNYIRENLTYGFSMAEMSTAFSYTPRYLGYLFKAKTGTTIKEYCNHLKILQAKKLLTETNMSVVDIAVQVGFNSITYFDRVFAKEVKLSPQAYRSSSRRSN